MTEEELMDCILEIDSFLESAESALTKKNINLALIKIKEARAAIEDLKEDDESEIDSKETIGMDVMNTLK